MWKYPLRLFKRFITKICFYLEYFILAILKLFSYPFAKILFMFGYKIIDNNLPGFGHLIAETTWFLLKKKLLEKKNIKKKYILYYKNPTNPFFLKMLSPYFIVINNNFLKKYFDSLKKYTFLLEDIGMILKLSNYPDYATNKKFIEEYYNRSKEMMIDFNRYKICNNNKILPFPEKMNARGYKNLEKLGVNTKDWFICLHAGEYDNATGGCHYHFQRRQTLENFAGVVRHVASKGGKIIRIGKEGGKLSIPPALPIIDYSYSDVKSDWMDLFLIDKCKFMICSVSGAYTPAILFGTPIILTNVISWYETGAFGGDICLLKHIFNKKTKSMVSLQEYNELNLKNELWNDEFEDNYVVIPNDTDELINAVEEMDLLLNNPSKLNKKNDLQLLLKSSFDEDLKHKYTDAIISPYFLKKNKKVLFKGTVLND